MIGSLLPLSFTTVDANALLEVVASVVDCFGKQHGRVKMHHVGNGIYIDRSVQMPDVPFVVVQYFVTNSDLYEVASERFDSEPKPSEPVKFIDGHVVARKNTQEYINGEVIDET